MQGASDDVGDNVIVGCPVVNGVGDGVLTGGLVGLSMLLNKSEPRRRSLEKVFLFGNNSSKSELSEMPNHCAIPFQKASLNRKVILKLDKVDKKSKKLKITISPC